MQTFTAVVEKCPDTGRYVGYVPGFPGAHSQGQTLDELNQNLREALSLLLEDGVPPTGAQFVGIQQMAVAWPHGQPSRPCSTGRRSLPAAPRLPGGAAKVSHKQFRRPNGRMTTVRFHRGQDISPILLRKIAQDIGVTVEQLLGRA